jgi:hypothetical protein
MRSTPIAARLAFTLRVEILHCPPAAASSTTPVAKTVVVPAQDISSSLYRISGSVRSADGTLLPGVDVEIGFRGKTITVRTGAHGIFKPSIPRDVDLISLRVVHLSEAFSGRMKPASQIDIRLVPGR